MKMMKGYSFKMSRTRRIFQYNNEETIKTTLKQQLLAQYSLIAYETMKL